MKTYQTSGLVLIFVLLFSFTTQAQVTTTSSFLLGGTISYNTSSSTIEVTQDGITTDLGS